MDPASALLSTDTLNHILVLCGATTTTVLAISMVETSGMRASIVGSSVIGEEGIIQ